MLRQFALRNARPLSNMIMPRNIRAPFHMRLPTPVPIRSFSSGAHEQAQHTDSKYTQQPREQQEQQEEQQQESSEEDQEHARVEIDDARKWTNWTVPVLGVFMAYNLALEIHEHHEHEAHPHVAPEFSYLRISTKAWPWQNKECSFFSPKCHKEANEKRKLEKLEAKKK